MAKTRTVQFDSAGVASLRLCDRAELGPGMVLIETHRTAISQGTERTFLTLGGPGGTFPFTPGYSVSGIVVEVGKGVRSLKVGDCVFAAGPHAAEVVVPEEFALKLPTGIDFEVGCFGNIAAMALYAVRQANLNLGDPVAIVGQGIIGLIANQVARCGGGLPVIGLDIDPVRLDLSLQFGADMAVDPRDDRVLADVLGALPGGGVEAAIELSGAGQGIDTALRVTRERGTVFAGSFDPNGHKVNIYGDHWWKGIALKTGYINSRPYMFRQLIQSGATWPLSMEAGGEFFGSQIYTSRADVRTVLDMAATRRLNIHGLISDHYAPEDAHAAFKRLYDRDKAMLGSVFVWR